jgi:uncharacterized protein YuzE
VKLVEALPAIVRDLEGALVRLGRADIADQLREVSLDRWAYDEFADAVYINLSSPRQPDFRPNVAGVRHGETLSLYDEVGINVDLDDHRRVTGVEILGGKAVADQLASTAGTHPGSS